VKTKDEFDPFTNVTADGKKEGKSKAKVDTIVYASVSHEEMTVKAFKDKLWKKAEMTLESLFRICDSSYEQAFSAAHFKEKLESLDLGLSGAEINRLIGIFDEDLSG
jgi:undecaprenyl pyrophosphate synthase